MAPRGSGRGGRLPPRGGVKKKTDGGPMMIQWWRRLVLPKRGMKDSLLSPAPLTEAQEMRDRERRAALLKAVIAPRATRLKIMSSAYWDVAAGRAVMQTAKGNALQSMGVFKDGMQILFPEEALYLVDKGQMELTLDKLPMSVQRTWSYCMNVTDSLSLEEYLAFAFLRRSGFAVRRFSKEDDGVPNMGITPSLCGWRVGGYTRRDAKSKPAFYVLVYRWEDGVPDISAIAKLSLSVVVAGEKTRIRLAMVDRGMVVFTDMAGNATPLSERFIRRLPDTKSSSARALREGDASAIFDDDVLSAFDDGEVKGNT